MPRKFIQLRAGTGTLAQPEPNFDITCQCCGQLPTVDIYNVEYGETHHTNLCGPCCFGEADCLDPENW